jgi:hypothetical protein
MSAAQLVVGLVDALSWPITVAALAVVFKRQLASLLDRVKSAKGAGVALEFREVVQELKLTAAEVQVSASRAEVASVRAERAAESVQASALGEITLGGAPTPTAAASSATGSITLGGAPEQGRTT